MNPINERIRQYLDYKGVSRYRAEKDCGMSKNLLGRSSNLSSGYLCKLLDMFPDLSAEWLLRGKGEMLIVEKTQEAEANYAHICKQMADMYEEVRTLRVENAVLKAKKEAVA